MGYTQTSSRSLSDLFGPRAQLATEDAALRMAKVGGEAMTKTVADLTPKRRGRTAASWHVKPVSWRTDASGATVFESGTETRSSIAGWLEHGTTAHDIPEHIRDAAGHIVGTRMLHVEGIRAHHMVATAAAIHEARLSKTLAEIVAEWARSVERG